jgi:hypothetical protein
MNAFFVGITQQEKNNILDQHKKIYDGYRIIHQTDNKPQPLYVQDFANDKEGLVVNNSGEVKKYTNVGINESEEMYSDLFLDEVEESECMECGMKETYEEAEFEDAYAFRDNERDEEVDTDFETIDLIGMDQDYEPMDDDELTPGEGDETLSPQEDEEDNNWMFVEDEFTENEDLDESFHNQRNRILEMFQRTSKF